MRKYYYLEVIPRTLLCLASIGIVIATTVIYALIDPGIQVISKILNRYYMIFNIQ